jgi:hypothetical protein
MAQPQEKEEQSNEPQPEVMPSSEPKVSIDLADLDEPDEQSSKQESTQDRKARRSQWRELKSDRDSARSELEALKARLAAVEQRGYQAPQAPAQPYRPQEEAKDPNESKLESIWEHQQALLQQLNTLPPGQDDRANKLTTQWRKLERERRELEVDIAISRREASAPPVDQERQMAQVVLRSEYPEIFSDPALKMRAQAELLTLIRQGRPDSLALAREACERVSPKKVTRQPTDAEKARYTSVASRAGASGASQGNFVPTTMQLRTARGYTKHLPDLTDEERLKKWIREVGKPEGLV